MRTTGPAPDGAEGEAGKRLKPLEGEAKTAVTTYEYDGTDLDDHVTEITGPDQSVLQTCT